MNLRIRRNALRRFAASLLLSEMSATDMRLLADELSHGNLGAELGEIIREIADSSVVDSSRKEIGRNKHQFERNRYLSGSQNSQIRAALSAVNRRRLSKRALWELMRAASPGFDTEKMFSTDAAIKEHVSKYFETVSANDAARFINLLEGDSADAYLKGISKRG
jgi:hypothetical protein